MKFRICVLAREREIERHGEPGEVLPSGFSTLPVQK